MAERVIGTTRLRATIWHGEHKLFGCYCEPFNLCFGLAAADARMTLQTCRCPCDWWDKCAQYKAEDKE